jgi:hypothetical protein
MHDSNSHKRKRQDSSFDQDKEQSDKDAHSSKRQRNSADPELKQHLSASPSALNGQPKGTKAVESTSTQSPSVATPKPAVAVIDTPPKDSTSVVPARPESSSKQDNSISSRLSRFSEQQLTSREKNPISRVATLGIGPDFFRWAKAKSLNPNDVSDDDLHQYVDIFITLQTSFK